MTITLKSYVSGRWVEGQGDFVDLVNPTTEDVVARASSKGIDFAAALDFARAEGNAALRRLTFAERGEKLAAAAAAIHEHREELIDIGIANCGNTRGDAKFDIDGASGTLSYYAKLGAKLGDRPFMDDGEIDVLGRGARFVGAHVRVPLLGAAVHINAFNFPAWGFGEKAAVAWLAGVPVITKPATSTAWMTFRIVEILIERDIFPAGALSLIAGSTGDLLTHLNEQDVLAFTGAGTTGAKLRSLPNMIERAVRVNVEADSLNAAVLGRDVEADSEIFDMFVREVSHDVTQKAGQKCTAIRRIFVPQSRLDDARQALIEAFNAVKVGNPAERGVRVGPVVNAAQHKDVRAGIEILKRSAEPIRGNGNRGQLVDIQSDKGFFVEPTLLYAADAFAANEVHDHEVFGPVATIMPYSGDPTEAAKLIGLGRGSLVSSLYTDDREIAAELLAGAAPHLGRLYIGCAKIADSALGPGTALPQSVHGGPGRAGGGEELGGPRGLAFYTQRTAVQGLKPMLEKLIG